MTTLALVSLLAVQSPAPAKSPAPRQEASAGTFVVLETSVGNITLRLLPDKAPLSVENFLKYVRDRHYDGTIFHRVKPGFMIQGGGMDANMRERKTRPAIKNESSNGLSNSRGTVAMARLPEPDSATAQFFINVKDNAFLDFRPGRDGYAVFGEVTQGMDIVDRIVAVPTTSKGPHEDVPVAPVIIKTARETTTKAP
jgi:cyclophilin family peptidyl-prolyl cis-trans isomerase